MRELIRKLKELWDLIKELIGPEPEPPTPPTPNPPSTGCPTFANAPASISGGFLWKPVSESDKRLVVLTPRNTRGHATSLDIFKGGSQVEKGRFVGDTHNGCRPHFRFSKAGADYGTGLEARLTLSNGTVFTWGIPNGARRVDA